MPLKRLDSRLRGNDVNDVKGILFRVEKLKSRTLPFTLHRPPESMGAVFFFVHEAVPGLGNKATAPVNGSRFLLR